MGCGSSEPKKEQESKDKPSDAPSSNQNGVAEVEREVPQDVMFDFDGFIYRTGNIKMFLTMKNTSKEKRKINIETKVKVTYNSGDPGQDLGGKKWEIKLEPDQEDRIGYEIPAIKYLEIMKDDGKVVTQTDAKVAGTGQTFEKTFIRKIDDPDLDMKTEKASVQKGDEIEVTICMKNPLQEKLTECELILKDSETNQAMKVPIKKSIDKKGKLEVKQKLKATDLGKREIIGSLSTKQLPPITGTLEIEVLKEMPKEKECSPDEKEA